MCVLIESRFVPQEPVAKRKKYDRSRVCATAMHACFGRETETKDEDICLCNCVWQGRKTSVRDRERELFKRKIRANRQQIERETA